MWDNGASQPVSSSLLNQIDAFIESLMAKGAQVMLAVGLCRTAGAVTCCIDKPRCSAASLLLLHQNSRTFASQRKL